MSIFTLLCFTVGFCLGVVFAAYVMATRALKIQDAIFEETGDDEESARLIPGYQQAVAIAAQCWSDAQTADIQMDTRLGLIFAQKIMQYIHALQWCSAASDFQPGGRAAKGFDKVCRPLMTPAMTPAIDVSRLSVEAYRSLRANAPELLGLERKV